MKKRGSLKSFTAGMLVMLVLTMSINVFGAETFREKIDVVYNNIKIVMDGKPVDLKDANGNKVEPFIYNGMTFLPIRAVGESIGKEVDWDGKTQTVYLGERPGDTKYLTETLKIHGDRGIKTFDLDNSEKISIAGKNFDTGYSFASMGNSSLRFNFNSEYKELSFYKVCKKSTPSVL